jgi:hypothetical protein
VVVLGKAQDAEETRLRLSQRVERASGIKPNIEVVAVPDANAFAGLESTLLTPHEVVAATAPSALAVEALKVNERVKTALDEVWPTKSAGDILNVALERGENDALLLKVLHWGKSLDGGAREAIEKSLGRSLAGPVSLDSLALTPQSITTRDGDLRFIAQVATTLRALRASTEVGVCLTRPDVGQSKATLSPEEKELAQALDAILLTQPGLTTVPGKTFELRLTRGACRGAATPSSGARDSSSAGASGKPAE